MANAIAVETIFRLQEVNQISAARLKQLTTILGETSVGPHAYKSGESQREVAEEEGRKRVQALYKSNGGKK